MGLPVNEMLARMSCVELAEWVYFAAIEPFGETRADLRMAILASLTANIHRDRKRRGKPYTASDFMPDFRTVEERAAAFARKWQGFKAFARKHNAKLAAKTEESH